MGSAHSTVSDGAWLQTGTIPRRETGDARPDEAPRLRTLRATPVLDVARVTLSAVEAGEEDIFPDPMSRQIYSTWRDDHKAVERLFGTM